MKEHEDNRLTAEGAVQTENKMGTLPIPRLLFGMSFPMMLSMLVQALYNIVDSIFVARFDQKALTAVSLVFPVQTLMIAVATSTGVGINALLSRNLGAKKFDEANRAAGNGLLLAMISAIIVSLLGFFGAGMFMQVQTDDALIVSYGISYMQIVTACCIGLYFSITFERLLQATGRTMYSMAMQLLGAVINIILDPILIFGYFGMPAMGISGAAAATVIGQIASMFLGVYFNLRKNPEIRVTAKTICPSLPIIAEIYKVGIPSFLMQAIGSVMTFLYNRILLMFTPVAVSVFGVYFKLNSFVFMPVFGLNNGMVPIVAYNYGARNKSRIMATIKLSAMVAVGLMLAGLAAFMIIPGQLLMLFDADAQMLEIGIPALRIIGLSFSFAGYCIVIGSVFQALGNGIYSMMVSMVRQLIVLLPVAYLLATIGGLSVIWWSFPIAEIASVAMTTFLFRRIYKEKLAQL